MTARSFVWLSLQGGAWSLASNWDDVTDGANPSLVAPGAQDSVTVGGPSGTQVQTITGNATVAAALFTGNTALSGNFSAGALTLGGAALGGLLQLGRGTLLQAASASIASGSMVAGPSGTLSVYGTLSLGAGGGAAALDATGGGAACVLAMLLTSAADSIYVDPTSIVEVGAAGGALSVNDQAGCLTIDAGAALTGQGSANAYGSVVNNGTMAASGGTLSVGAVGGTGTLQIGAGATLALNGTCASGQTVVFAGANATLAINREFNAPAGSVSGFAPGDAIDMRGSTISSATYASGVLTLFYAGQVAASLQLAGSYTGSVFLTAGDGAGGTLITVAQGAGGGGGGPSPGTANPDQYAWIAAGSGAWNRAANWKDLTTGATPAGIAPGVNDLVTIAASQSVFSVLSGPANAASLSVTGQVGLSGAYTLGTLTVGQAAGATFTNGTLDQLAGTAIGAASAWVAAGAISVAGSASVLSVAGTLTLGGGPSGVGLPIASLGVTAGGSARAASLTMGGGSGASLTTDPTGTIEVGTAGNASVGAITVDAGATLAGNGSANPYSSIVDNGTILASGGTLSLGAVSGTGSLVIAAGATLELLASTAAPIGLLGSAASGSILALSSARAAPTGTLTGFGLGDVIHLEGSSLTSVQLQQSGTSGTLLLIYGTTTVARIALAGLTGTPHFIMTPDGTDGTDITVDTLAGGGGTGGQTGTDQLAWTSPVSGGWNRAACWTDVTTGKVATLPPGTQTPVLVTGPGGYVFQSVSGPGTCSAATFLGNTALAGIVSAGRVTVGQASTQGSAAVAGAVDVSGATTLTAAQALVSDGELLCIGGGGMLLVTGTLGLGGAPFGSGQPDALLDIGGHAGGQIGGLTMGGGDSNAVTVDATAWLEVGTAGGAAVGAVTVDAGSLISGNGTLNAYGPVIDNGTILAQGGTLIVGATSGSGSLAIDTEATLALGGGAACSIAFTGQGATLILPASALPTGVISGFSTGDSIITAAAVDTVAFVPGAGGVGTLSLWAGSSLVGQLALAGNFAGETFAAQTDGSGAAITVAAQVFTGPPPGTVTPDAYRWTGAAGTAAWNASGNWIDVSQGAGPAYQPPGQNDLVSIAGGNGTALTVAGPANAASLSIAGTVALAGVFAAGTLSVASGALLALGYGTSLSAAGASVGGGLAVGTGTLSVSSNLVLGAGGVLGVSNQGIVRAGTLTLGGGGAAIAVDAGSAVEIGGTTGAVAGSVTIDAGGVLQGAGVVALAGQTIDQGSIVASGGTLVLGAVSGTGTLLTGLGADTVLRGAVGSGLTADFAGAGTLDLTAAQGAPAIADFGTGDSILLPVSGAASAAYAVTAPGIGLLSIFDPTGRILTQLTLLGSQAGRAFNVAGISGGTILTTQPDSSGPGGSTMAYYPPLSSGTLQFGDLLNDVAVGFPYVPQAAIRLVTGLGTTYLDFSTDGLPSAPYFGGAQGPGANVEIVAPLDGLSGSGVGPDSLIAMQPGYEAVLLEGNEPLALTDWDGLDADGPVGHALLAGNYGNDTIVASGDGDTLVGGTGANTVFFAHLSGANGTTSLPVDVYIQGGGNDTIATTQDNASITTSGGNSEVFLSSQRNTLISNGSDTIVCTGQSGSDTIFANAAAGRAGDLVFAAASGGRLIFTGGDAPDTIVGQGTQISMQGGRGNGSLIFAGSSNLSYIGGAGSAVIIGASGPAFTSVQGGTGAVTVFGGTGFGLYSGASGSVFVVGAGASTVTAGAGTVVYAVGAGNVNVTASNGAIVYGGSSTGNDLFRATDGAQVLWGGTGTDQFIAGSGPDVMISGGGRDVFSFAQGDFAGTDVIYGFQTGQDKISLSGLGTPQISTAFGDTIVHLQNGAQIVVANVTNLTSQNFTVI